jgi:hypothetical protein
MAGGTMEFHRTITRRRALVGMNKKQQQHQKQKPFEGKTMEPLGANTIRVPKNELDAADFLIDGLTSRRASGAENYNIKLTHALPWLFRLSGLSVTVPHT